MGKYYLYAPEVSEKIAAMMGKLSDLDAAIYPITGKFGFHNNPEQLELNMLDVLGKALAVSGEVVEVMKLLRTHKDVTEVQEPMGIPVLDIASDTPPEVPESTAGLSATTADLRPEAAISPAPVVATAEPVTVPLVTAPNPAGESPAMGGTPTVVTSTPVMPEPPKPGVSLGLEDLVTSMLNIGGNLLEGLAGDSPADSTDDAKEDPTAPAKEAITDDTPRGTNDVAATQEAPQVLSHAPVPVIAQTISQADVPTLMRRPTEPQK